jgi:hypothetical protein
MGAPGWAITKSGLCGWERVPALRRLGLRKEATMVRVFWTALRTALLAVCTLVCMHLALPLVEPAEGYATDGCFHYICDTVTTCEIFTINHTCCYVQGGGWPPPPPTCESRSCILDPPCDQR